MLPATHPKFGIETSEGVMRSLLVTMLACLLLGACGGNSLGGADLPRGAAAYSSIAPDMGPQAELDRDYRIGPQDSLSISVFGEPELSTPANAPLQVDARGNIEMKLIGTVPAAGKTATELAAVIADRLGTNLLVNPQVTVSVTGSVSQKVIVQGDVVQSGVFEIRGRTTLLEALAMARGENRTASLSEVAVFRNVTGQRTGAIFDVNEIRKGNAPDPEILGNDIVVVGRSTGKSLWRDILSTTPLLGIFSPF